MNITLFLLYIISHNYYLNINGIIIVVVTTVNYIYIP
jgi:hypothetical protein